MCQWVGDFTNGVCVLGRCLWPFQYFSLQLPPHPTPFIEVFLADGLTSLSKFIQDSAVAMLLLSISFSQDVDDLRTSYVSKMKQSPLPYFAASAPYMYVCNTAVAFRPFPTAS